MLTKSLFDEMMFMMCEIYNREAKKLLLNGYWMILKHMSDDDFKAAILSLLATRQSPAMPKPAEIMEFIRPDLEAIATLAVIDIENAVSRHGVYSSVSFDDPVVNSIVDHLGGWIAVCRMDLNDWKFAKKEIPRLYGVYARRERHPEHLVGMHERSNGFVQEVRTVGAGYRLPNVRTVHALNPQPKKDMAVVSMLAESKKVKENA